MSLRFLARLIRASGILVAPLLLGPGCGRLPRPHEPTYDESQIDAAAAAVVKRVAGAKIIGLGEMTHGEGMTQRLRTAVLRRAVEELGCDRVVLDRVHFADPPPLLHAETISPSVRTVP